MTKKKIDIVGTTTYGKPNTVSGIMNFKPVSSKSLRAERRLKTIKALYTHSIDILKIGTGVAVGVGILWIIQVGVTSI